MVRQKQVKGRLLTRLWNDFYDPKKASSFGGFDSFLKHSGTAKSLKTSQVKHFLRQQNAYLMHYPARKRFKRNKTISLGKDYVWQADLVDMSALSRFNGGNNYLLTVIDVLSKYAWAMPIKRKTGSDVSSALHEIFQHRKPIQLCTDAGKEFLNRDVQNLLKDNDIHFFTAPSADVKAAVAERFNRTLKQRMWKYFTARETLKYTDVIQDLVDSYNKKTHSSTGMAPNKVTIDNQDQVFEKLYGRRWPSKRPLKAPRFKFRIGDVVKLSRVKRLFEKGYVSNWTKENFVVYQRLHRSPPVYKVQDESGEDVKGVFYEAELLKVST